MEKKVGFTDDESATFGAIVRGCVQGQTVVVKVKNLATGEDALVLGVEMANGGETGIVPVGLLMEPETFRGQYADPIGAPMLKANNHGHNPFEDLLNAAIRQADDNMQAASAGIPRKNGKKHYDC